MSKSNGQDQNVSNNANIRVCFPPNEYTTAQWISHQLGTTTVTTEMRSRHARRLLRSPLNENETISTQYTGRQLLLADAPVSLLYQKGRGLPHLSGSRPRDRRFHVERENQGTAVLTNSDLSVIIAITSL
jgi:hypothetical protein